MFRYCPGIRGLVDPGIIVKTCPFCGEDVEFLEYEIEQTCPGCGKKVRREASEACVSWCNYADKCIDDLLAKGVISEERAEMLRKILERVKYSR